MRSNETNDEGVLRRVIHEVEFVTSTDASSIITGFLHLYSVSTLDVTQLRLSIRRRHEEHSLAILHVHSAAVVSQEKHRNLPCGVSRDTTINAEYGL